MVSVPSGSGSAAAAATAAGATCTAKPTPAPKDTRAFAPAVIRNSLLAALWPCALYLCCSFAMNMLTKILLTTYQWRALYTLGAVQNTFTMASVLALRGGQFVWAALVESSAKEESGHGAVQMPRKSAVTSRLKLPDLSYVLKVMVPLVALHIGNMILGFASMRIVNMPVYLVLRRLTTLKVMLIEWLLLHKEMSTQVKLALLLSTLGSVIAGSTDVTSNVIGYVLVLLQNLCSAFSLTFSKESALSSMELVLLNSTAGSLICSLLAYYWEHDAVTSFSHLYDAQFLSIVGVMCCVCVLYQFSIFVCTIRNSALATSVTGNVKDLISTVCGFLFFPDVQIRFGNVAGVVLSFLGAYSFSYLKYRALALERNKPKQT